MRELEHRLNNLPNTYFAFVHGIATYASKKPERYNVVMDYLDANPNSSPSDVTQFVMSQPDFFDDDVRNMVNASQRMYN